MEYADSRRSPHAGGRLPTTGEVARKVGLDLVPPAAFGFHIPDNGTVSSHLLKRIAAGQEAVAFLDETTRQVYKIYNVRSSTMGGMGWGAGKPPPISSIGARMPLSSTPSQAATGTTLSPAAASGYRMGLKLAATKHNGKWEVDTRSGNLFDMIEKVIALDGAGALPTVIMGMLDTGDHFIVNNRSPRTRAPPPTPTALPPR